MLDIQIYGSRTIRVKKPGGGFDEATLGFSKLPHTAEEVDIRQAIRVGEHVLEELRESLEIQLGIHASQRPLQEMPKPVLAGIFNLAPAPVAEPIKPKKREASQPVPGFVRHRSSDELREEELQQAAEDADTFHLDKHGEKVYFTEDKDIPDLVAGIDPAPTHDVTDPFDARNQADIPPTRTATNNAAYEPDPEDLPPTRAATNNAVCEIKPEDLPPIAEQIAAMPIPAAEDVNIQPIFTGVLGIGIAVPPEDDERWSIPLTDVNRDDTGGGQLKAINAAITGVGFGNKERHQVCETILNAIDRERPRVKIESTRDLSKAQAHVILSWFEQATDQDISRLGNAVRGVAI